MSRELSIFLNLRNERMFSSSLIIIFHLTRPNFIKEGSFQFFFTFYGFHTTDSLAFRTGVVGRDVSFCDGPRPGSSHGSLIQRMIDLKTDLNSRHAHISSKEYFEETYSKFSKWTSNGGRPEGWFWFGKPVFRVSLVPVVVASIFSLKRRLFESIGFERLFRGPMDGTGSGRGRAIWGRSADLSGYSRFSKGSFSIV